MFRHEQFTGAIASTNPGQVAEVSGTSPESLPSNRLFARALSPPCRVVDGSSALGHADLGIGPKASGDVKETQGRTP